MRATSIIVTVACLSCASVAQAASITFAFTGEVTSVGVLDNYDFVTPPDVGATFSGTYTFESNDTDSIADPATGSYGGSALTLELGGQPFAFPAVNIGVTEGYSTFGFNQDQYLVGFADADTTLSIRLTDFTDSMFATDALPVLPMLLTGLWTEFFFQDTNAIGGVVDLNGIITSLNCVSGCDPLPPAPIPEPGTIALVGGGLATFLARARRRSQQR
jgi:hypothetical protein